MPPKLSDRANMRWIVRQWLLSTPDDYQFTLLSAHKALGLKLGKRTPNPESELGGAFDAFVGHLIETPKRIKGGGYIYKVLPVKERTPDNQLPR